MFKYHTLVSSATLMEGYCVKCKTRREINSAQNTTMANGKPAVRGQCGVCGTKMFVIGKSL